MSRFSSDINSMSRELSKEELLDICEKWFLEQERWNNYNPINKFYLEDGSYGDFFLHEIQAVDASNRTCLVVDLSQFSRPIKYINYLPVAFPTQKEAIDYYSKKYPSIF